MKSFVKRTLLCTAALWMLLDGIATLTFAQKVQRYENAHLVAQTTIEDLYSVIDQYPDRDSGQWRALILRAQKNLSDFDRSLADGVFNTDLLNEAIASVKNALKNDRMGRKERDSLNADLYDLSRLRAAPAK